MIGFPVTVCDVDVVSTISQQDSNFKYTVHILLCDHLGIAGHKCDSITAAKVKSWPQWKFCDSECQGKACRHAEHHGL